MKYTILRVEYLTGEGIIMIESSKKKPVYETDNLEELRAKLHADYPCRNILFGYYEKK